MKVFLVIAIALLIIFIGVGINLIIKKNGVAPSSCASSNPMFADENGVCGSCGKQVGEDCKN